MITIDEACINCNLCLTSCPQMLLKKEPDKIIVGDDCDDCGECIESCPIDAISFTQED